MREHYPCWDITISLNAMWDTTFTNSVSDVVLDVHDVGECLG
ncbi:MAG: hypothetical protein ACK5QF_13540 [Dolichospermum sp.]|jgi:putative transposase